MSYQPFYDGLSVARGLVPKVSVFRKFGANTAVGTSEVYISAVGGVGPYMPTTAVALEAISSDSNDTAAGTGAQQITLFGINGSGVDVTETLEMNGTSATSDTSNAYFTLYRAYVSRTGTYSSQTAIGSNLGTITIRGGTGTPDVASIGIGDGQTQLTHYTVPAGYSLYVTHVQISVGSAKAVDVHWYQRPNSDDVTTPFTGARRVVALYDGVVGEQSFTYSESPIKFPAYTDLWFTGVVASATGSVSVEYSGYLVQD